MTDYHRHENPAQKSDILSEASSVEILGIRRNFPGLSTGSIGRSNRIKYCLRLESRKIGQVYYNEIISPGESI